MNEVKRRPAEIVVPIVATTCVVLTSSAATGLLIYNALDGYATLTVADLAVVYSTQLSLLYLLVSWLQPRRRRTR